MRRRIWYWLAIVAALACFGGGLTIAYLGSAAPSGPAGTVRGYFAALQRGDAPEALAYGAVPHGPHLLLTSDVLAEQQRIAPIRGFSVTSTAQHGNRATVRVSYTVAFPGRPQRQQDDIRVRRSGDTWRLVRTAVATRLDLPAAALRATITRAGIPQGTVLMFPGAVPIRYDSPYLELAPATAVVSFGSKPHTTVVARVSATGRHRVVHALVRMLTTCLSAGPRQAVGCPAPAPRYVPGTVRGRLVGNIRDQLIILLAGNDDGRLDVSGRIQVRGHYRWLTFTNQARTRSGRFELDVQAYCYAVRPLRLAWDATP